MFFFFRGILHLQIIFATRLQTFFAIIHQALSKTEYEPGNHVFVEWNKYSIFYMIINKIKSFRAIT